MNSTDLQSALRSLPHGPGFRFVDRVISLTPGKTGIGEYQLRGDEPFLTGHFPGDPMMPGVLLVEAAAQLAGVVVQSDPTIPPLPHLRLTAIRAVKIFGTARPGDVLSIEATLTARLGNLVQCGAKVWVRDVLVLSAEVTLAGTI